MTIKADSDSIGAADKRSAASGSRPRSGSGSTSDAETHEHAESQSPASPLDTLDAAVEELALAIDQALQARTRVVEWFSNKSIIDALATAAELWLDDDYEPRRRAAATLSQTLRLDADMVRYGLTNIFSAITRDSLHRLIAEETSSPEALEHPCVRPSGVRARLLGPRLVFHSLAGNVPGLGIPPTVASLLARSVSIIRDSTRQPVLTPAFLQTLSELAPELGAMVVAVTWPAGDVDLEQQIISIASRVEIYGSDETIRTVAARYPGRTIVGHGERTSIGVISAAADTDAWASGFAHDVTLYEGRGCLTPKVIYVEGGPARAIRFAKRLSLALARLEKLWPRREQDLASEVARRSFIDEAEVAAASESGQQVLRGRDDAWCIHVGGHIDPAEVPGLRCVSVVAVDKLEPLVDEFANSPIPVAAVGLGLDELHRDYDTLRARLHAMGATLVCAPGRMQAPPIGWSQDGLCRLADLLQWRAEEPQ